MNIENQVANLKLSQKMYELQFKQESEWYWIVETGNVHIKNQNDLFGIHNDHLEAFYSAYTVAELGEMLPYKIGNWCLDIAKEVKGIFYISYSGGNWGFEVMNNNCFRDKSEANARAKMLIWLKENNYL